MVKTLYCGNMLLENLMLKKLLERFTKKNCKKQTKKSLDLKNVKVELDLSNCATKTDLKNATGADTSKFAKEVDLANLKSKVDKEDIGKLETTPEDLNGLSDVLKNDSVKKTVFDELVKKVNAIETTDTSNLVK